MKGGLTVLGSLNQKDKVCLIKFKFQDLLVKENNKL